MRIFYIMSVSQNIVMDPNNVMALPTPSISIQ